MKAILVFCAIITLAYTARLDDPRHAQILRYDSENSGIDGYNFAFETSDGVSRQEQAQLKNIGRKDEAIVVRGIVSWIGDDGVKYTLNYVADENGYQPEGAHLVKPQH